MMNPKLETATATSARRRPAPWRLQESLDRLEFTEPLQPIVDEIKILNRLKITSPEQWPNIEGMRLAALRSCRFQPELASDSKILISCWSFFNPIACSVTPFQAGCIARGDADLLRLPRHVLRQRVGQGWKGEVFEATSIDVEGRPLEVVRTFAPEAMRGLSGDYNERLKSFLEKCAQLAAAAQHPAFPKILSFDTYSSRVHPRLAYVAYRRSGQSARSFAERNPWPSAKERVRWAASVVRQAAELPRMHAKGCCISMCTASR
jgi:hypothetical protein